MSKKRQSQDSGESSAPEKKAKPSKNPESEFNGTVFKFMLKDPSQAFKGLETFISTAKKLPCTNLYDVVEGYIKISVECAEIFHLLDGEKHTENELMLVFQSLEMVLLRTASDLSHFSMVGSTIVKKITSSHMKLLQSSLHSENHRFVRQCLSLLSVMVSQGSEAAREVLSHTHFSRGLSALAMRRDKMGKPDVRMAYIQFALSFLLSGDNATIGQILETKDLLSDILITGLKEDRLSIVNLVLTTLTMKVVQNKALSKTQKVRFFSAAVLAQLAGLYRWNGVVDVSMDDSQGAASDDERGKQVVRELVHSFLQELCCSRKHGISFHDPSLGTAGRAGNIVLLQFAVGLKQASEDGLVAELLVSVLKSCPDLLARYLRETQLTFTPRLKTAWNHNITLLKQIYEAQPEVSRAFQTREFIPLPRLLSMVTVTTLPPVCDKAFFNVGLNLPNTLVQHTTLSMAVFILKRAQCNMEVCLDRATWQNSEIYTPANMEEFVQLYREALSKVLPDMTTIISKWQSLTKKDKEEGAGKTSETTTDGQKRKTTANEHGQDDPNVILLKALILQVMCLYQKVVPHLVNQCKFDFSKLLAGIMSERGLREGVPPILQEQILKLALELPASKFSWFRLQDLVDAEAGSGQRGRDRDSSVFYLLLKMFVGSSGRLHKATHTLALKVLKDSGVFEHTWRELELWLYHLAALLPGQQEPVIEFLDQVLMRVVCNSHIYTDRVSSLVQEAASLQASVSGQEGDALSIPISHIDDVLDMVDVIMEGGDDDIEELGPALTDDVILHTFPFSPVVPAALEARNKLQSNHGDKPPSCQDNERVLCDILHSQREPLALCLTLQQYDKELHSSVQTPHPSITSLHLYSSRWLPQQAQERLFESGPSVAEGPAVGFAAVMKAAYSQGPSAFLPESFRQEVQESLVSLHIAAFPVAVSQTLLYLKTTLDSFHMLPKATAVEVVGSLVDVVHALVTKLQSLEDPAPPEPTDTEGEKDLFLDASTVSPQEASKEQVLLSVLRCVLKHPTLDLWFLGLELGSLPAHSAGPAQLRPLCARLTTGTLALLLAATPSLRALGAMETAGRYLSASRRALLMELAERAGRAPVKESLPVKVFLALHEYMDSPCRQEVVSTLLLLPQASLVAPGDSGSGQDLGVYGRAALRVLTDSMGSPAQDGSLFLSHAHLQGLATLFTSCLCAPLEDFLLQVLRTEPGSAKLLGPEVLFCCLGRDSEASRAIGPLLLQNSPTHTLSFQLWALDPQNRTRTTLQNGVFLSLVQSYLQRSPGRTDDPTQPSGVHAAVLKTLRELLLPGLWGVIKDRESGDSLTQCVDILCGLIQQAVTPSDLADLSELADLMQELPSVLLNPHSHEKWPLADSVSEILGELPERRESWRQSILSVALRWLVGAYGGCKEQQRAQLGEEQAVLRRLHTLLILPREAKASDWNSFVKTGLKYRYRDDAFLGALTTLLDLMYGGPDVPKELLPLATIHMMVTSHSLFLPTMLGDPDDPSSNPQSKEALVSLLLSLVKACPEVCHSSHLLVLLGAYGATLSATDQRLMLLLQEYEKNSISLVQFQSVLWGPAAVEHHKARKSLGPSLWQQPSSEELLSLLEMDKMVTTVTHYPQQRRIIPQDGKELIYRAEGEGAPDPSSLYDPCFLLALFSTILRPESVIDCLKFVTCHALGVAVMALSSYDPKVRAAASHVLGSFYQHLEGARFREKKQLLYLLDTVRNGIREQNSCVPFVLTTYVARVGQQMLRPEEHMYVVLNKFLLGHQYLDLKRVPEFFKLFYSFDLEHRMEREWMLTVLEEGVVDRHCYALCDQQGVYHILLGYSTSPLCDQATQLQIVRVLCQTARVTKAAYCLVTAHGILTWVLQMLDRKAVDGGLRAALVGLLHTLWFTNLGEKESVGTATGERAKCLPLPFINDFLSVLTSLTRYLRVGVEGRELKLFLQTIASVLRHRGTALGVHSEAGWLTLRPQPLGSAQALRLLQRWATLSHNHPLLSVIQALANQHALRELQGSGRERSRGRGSLSKNPRGRPDEQSEREGEETEGEETEGAERAALEECKHLLGSILTHWAPAPIPACTSLTPDPSESGRVDGGTAVLLASWTLRSLAEAPYDGVRTAACLKWLQGVMTTRRDIIASFLGDNTVKSDLLRLFHRACENAPQGQDSSEEGVQGTGGLSTKGEELRLFVSVMLPLLEAQGNPAGDLHQRVLASCLPQTPRSQTHTEAGLVLLSLHVHEVWSGAETPTLLLSHARRVLSASEKNQTSKNTTALEDICRDLLSATE